MRISSFPDACEMDLAGRLPGLCEQYGSRGSGHTNRYVCDHVGIRRVKQRATRLGVWKRMNKFVKVTLILWGVRMAICSFCLLSSVLATH